MKAFITIDKTNKKNVTLLSTNDTIGEVNYEMENSKDYEFVSPSFGNKFKETVRTAKATYDDFVYKLRWSGSDILSKMTEEEKETMKKVMSDFGDLFTLLDGSWL